MRRFVRVSVLSCGLIAVLGAGRQAGDVRLRDLGGHELTPFTTGTRASVVFFIATDCPVSNGYAPEIQRVCGEYRPRGVGCSLVYEDVDTASASQTLDAQVRRHLGEFKYESIPAAIDRERAAATHARASITPTAVVVDRSGAVRYRGRVDNLYAALGKTRQQVTSHDLRDALDAVLAGHPVTHPETEAIGCYITDPALLRTHHHE
ncbi:MAG TPA: redoxin domain-containing protein [Vicinamibacterales bacterium]